MESLKNLGKILSLVALIIVLIGAISTGDIVFMIASLLSTPYLIWRISNDFKPWSKNI